MRWTGDQSEVAFYGVNYTVPFAYGYRALKTLGIDPEQAIREDVYHFSRLGMDAFRVHVWDTEISDTVGNLLQNEHLRLFDFLIAELKKRKIKILITPIAFWGNGYPDPDEHTPGFSRKYGKEKALREEPAIAAQENYLRQFFRHTNPYTGVTYGNDPDVVAMEINNEPSHSGPQQVATDYVNRMTEAVRSTGWTKPVFYNISQSPWYAAAVVKAKVDGHSFQWYPTGLVANRTLQGNWLPHVDVYHIPFIDTIPAFSKRARMVYEFDAGDIYDAYMYPAMARSFRTAGFQWATQFAYDPIATAYANTEYQTHFLNLAYTPAKAISMLIASEVFHRLPRNRSYGSYPADTLFGDFRVSYRERLSEMNAADRFYYSGTTQTTPRELSSLTHIAGTGSSPIVRYAGTGAYFLDKLASGCWRLEVMPDAIQLRDPFESPSLQREAVRIVWQEQPLTVSLPDLGETFEVIPLNEGNTYRTHASAKNFRIRPGAYLLKHAGTAMPDTAGLTTFVAPAAQKKSLEIAHHPLGTATAGHPIDIHANIAGIAPGDKVMLLVNRLYGASRRIEMQGNGEGAYHATVPAELVQPGVLQYRIKVKTSETTLWETKIVQAGSDVVLYDPATDRHALIYPPYRRNSPAEYVTDSLHGNLALRFSTGGFLHETTQHFAGRKNEDASWKQITVHAVTNSTQPVTAKLYIVDEDAFAWSATFTITSSTDGIALPLSSFRPDSLLLLPRPYPGFHPLWFDAKQTTAPDLRRIERTGILIEQNTTESPVNISSIRLQK